MKKIHSLLKSQLFLFMLMGTISTLTMLAIYAALNMVMKYQISYFISYVITIIFSYFLNTLFVFKKPPSLRTFLQFPLIYLVQYVIGAILLEILVRLGFSVTFAPALIIILLLPLTYSLSRLVIK